ncbi:hypothetical protein BV22DRAFT_1018244 [Leucogyrophana mollusca]|uniref:Uncharacterized protein n=1 Tax=Leucogyrophana mollusca TaxID=85980 RepID=A0ACB8B8S7_9AGAM|nr:hypothetical protein BV22DRAFT_1018244 [Leucogyrophana mollusca]
MSELDADLYGDLYGNDETDFSAVDSAEQPKTEETSASEAPVEPQAPTPAKAPQLKQESPPVVSTGQTSAPETSAIQTYEDYTASSAQATSSSYVVPGTQQIPTYQQPSSSDFDDRALHQASGGYDHAQMPERSIRPSEMKDEG